MSGSKPRRKATKRKRRSGPKKSRLRVWLWAVLSALFVIGAGVGWWRYHRYFRPIPAGARMDGIDVSRYQSEINWHDVAGVDAVRFVMVKATEGATEQDRFFHENVWQAREEGLHVGAYMVYSPLSSPDEQFRNFRDYVKDAELDLIPCIDVEENVSREKLTQNVMRIVELMEAHYGKKPLLYVNAHVYNDYFHPVAAGCELWIPNYSRKPAIRGDERPFIWQYSDVGRLPGIDGDVDLDCFVNGMTVDRLRLR